VLGTWLPFVLIFTATYLVGLYAVRHDHTGQALRAVP
jgi:hypothetical protein